MIQASRSQGAINSKFSFSNAQFPKKSFNEVQKFLLCKCEETQYANAWNTFEQIGGADDS